MLLFIKLLVLFFILDSVVAFALAAFRKGSPSKMQGIYAKFSPGAIVSEIRGKIASTVFSRNKGGAVIRNRIVPINKRSALQTQRRQVLASFAAQWRGLTQAQRDGWNSAAANFPVQDSLGQTIFLSGEQLYIRCNTNLTLISQSTISDAPVPTSFAVVALGASVISSAASTVAFTPDPVPAGYNLVIRATPQLSPGRNFAPQSAFRFIQAEAAAATSPADIATSYEALFGDTFVAGQKVFIEAYLVEIASGLSGQVVRQSVIVT